MTIRGGGFLARLLRVWTLRVGPGPGPGPLIIIPALPFPSTLAGKEASS